MTELELYKFITDNDVEYHCYSESKIFAMINLCDIEEFNKLLGNSILDDEGLECIMKDGYFCFEMGYICEYFGIDSENIFFAKD